MSLAPVGGGGSGYAIDAATFNALSTYDSAVTAQASPQDAPDQVDKLQQAESDVMDKVGQSMLARYQTDTGNAQATMSQMEADTAGFAKATQELSAQSPANAHTIAAVAWTLGADHDVGQAEAAAGHAHASADAVNLAGITQLSTDFQSAGTNALPADIAAFASQSPLVQRLLSTAQTSALSGDANAKAAFQAPLAALHTSLSGIEDNASLPQAAQNGVSYTMTHIDTMRGVNTPTDTANTTAKIRSEFKHMAETEEQFQKMQSQFRHPPALDPNAQTALRMREAEQEEAAKMLKGANAS